MGGQPAATELRYCPRCASPLAWRSFEYAEIQHPACAACGYVLWQNPKPCADALIVREGDTGHEVLFGRLAGTELWDTPGGFLNVGDRIAEALVRECRREMDIEVRAGTLVGAWQDIFMETIEIVVLFYRCTLVSGEPRPADIIDAVRWWPVAEPPPTA